MSITATQTESYRELNDTTHPLPINYEERVLIVRDRILNLDYDWIDAEDPDNKQDENPEGSINEARNIAIVATAASTDPPDENVDIDG